jgi:hypothetical protein
MSRIVLGLLSLIIGVLAVFSGGWLTFFCFFVFLGAGEGPYHGPTLMSMVGGGVGMTGSIGLAVLGAAMARFGIRDLSGNNQSEKGRIYRRGTKW